jgi:uncharacterized membrane protein YedE/YeeE
MPPGNHAPLSAVEPVECIDTEQVPAPLKGRALAEGNEPAALLGYLVLGVLFGVVLVESQVVSWFRIQEMFRFDAFHMYGLIGSAVVTAALSLWATRRLGLKTLHGEPIVVSRKAWGEGRVPGARYWMGGTVFGLGWALLGACPGPVFALVGGGYGVMAVALLAALVGTWVYAALQPRLPH